MAKKKISIRDLYPGLTDEEYEEAEVRLRRYVQVLAEIYESRLSAEDNDTRKE